ncbi:MAG: molecular chaperone HtpG [Christensenellaceae bacterium]|nr:molecular chaperone HtpG [Christensenellaceae bacterium]
MRKFKTESQRVLDIMINSIYTHKEIFLREIISNASDAIDKLYYKSLKENLGLAKEDFEIKITIDPSKRTLVISDNGIGMTTDELENNLGVIAKSGSLEFKKTIEKTDDLNIIGQFGVGFYSSFMVSDKVEVISKAYGQEDANLWTSKGTEGYDILKSERDTHGTTITLYLKEATENDTYDEFLTEYKMRELIKKYSDYIRYPIKMDVSEEVPIEGEKDKFETKIVTETLNSMVPIWKKRKADITAEEYNSFYKSSFFDYEDPIRVIHTSVEGATNFTALLFIPSKTPYNYYSKNYEKGLKLYANDVMIMEKSQDLLPDFFGFVKGLVDSDVTLNLSRETVQKDSQLKKICSSLEKKVKSELLDMLENDREKYEKFYKAFGLQLKYGIYEGWGVNKDTLVNLIMFVSTTTGKHVSLKEYVANMKEDQKFIYYASGSSADNVKSLPQAEKLLDLGYDILVFSDDVDEFSIKMIETFEGKEFKSISASGDLGIKDEETPTVTDDDKLLTDFIKKALDTKVSNVKISTRLKNHPVCLTEEGPVSIEMEKILNAMPAGSGNEQCNVSKSLEINASHPIFDKLKYLLKTDEETLTSYANVLYEQARLIAGLSVDSPASLAATVLTLLAK